MFNTYKNSKKNYDIRLDSFYNEILMVNQSFLRNAFLSLTLSFTAFYAGDKYLKKNTNNYYIAIFVGFCFLFVTIVQCIFPYIDMKNHANNFQTIKKYFYINLVIIVITILFIYNRVNYYIKKFM